MVAWQTSSFQNFEAREKMLLRIYLTLSPPSQLNALKVVHDFSLNALGIVKFARNDSISFQTLKNVNLVKLKCGLVDFGPKGIQNSQYWSLYLTLLTRPSEAWYPFLILSDDIDEIGPCLG